MEKERILSDLKTKIGDPNVAPKFSNITERTLNEYVDQIFPTIKEGDVIDDSFYNTHIGILETLAGNIRFAASSAVEDFRKNLKQEPPTPQPNPSAPTPSNPNDEIAKKLKELEDFKTSLEKRYQDEAKVAQRNSLIADAKKKATDQGAVDETVLSFVLPLINPSDNDTADTLSATIKTKYDEAYTKLKGGGYNPAAGNSSISVNPVLSGEAKKLREKAAEERKKMKV